jgi:hypothetical protein
VTDPALTFGGGPLHLSVARAGKGFEWAVGGAWIFVAISHWVLPGAAR